MKIVPAEDVHTVLETALCEKPAPRPKAEPLAGALPAMPEGQQMLHA